MEELKGYQWPASALTVKEMGILYELREQETKPITQLLKEAIIALSVQYNKGKKGVV